jgi:hypothetical protein
MLPDPGTIVTLASIAIGSVIWLVRLEGRVNSHDREIKDVKDSHESDMQQIRLDLNYIRGRIDRAIEKP